MTDEEILYGLRNPPVMSMALSKDDLYGMMRERMQVAADCIEQLVAQLKMILEREAETQARHDSKIDALEAKLAKAKAALRKLVICVDDGCYCSEQNMAAAVDEAREALAEIKGETK